MNTVNKTQVYLSLGSNIDAEFHIKAGLDALHEHFSPLSISSVYESEAVGFAGDNFLNLVVGLQTDKTVAELDTCLKTIEDENGRLRKGPKFSARTLDIDILLYGGHVGVVDGVTLPREEILYHAFVLLPMVDLAPQELHPVKQQTYQQLWDNFHKKEQKLWPINFEWQGLQVSSTQ